MKNILIAAALVFASISAQANQTCSRFSSLAETIMTAHQSGVAMQDLVEDLGNDERAKKSVMPIIIAAYQKPRFSTEEYKQRAIDSFRDQVAVACYKKHSK